MGKVDRLCNTVELNLLLPYFGFSALYLPTPDLASWPSTTPPLNTKHVLIQYTVWS